MPQSTRELHGDDMNSTSCFKLMNCILIYAKPVKSVFRVPLKTCNILNYFAEQNGRAVFWQNKVNFFRWLFTTLILLCYSPLPWLMEARSISIVN